ncbi:DNA topoisomerase IV subunit A [Candidatus Thorarchaeota archaeon]|nr:MAG: DNA topoisomerase IV subunit A [Candidatus Thorarchaeota archaeon]
MSYDPVSKRFRLGKSKVVRDSGNLRHVSSFSKLLWVASYTKRLLETGRTSSLRDLYYSSEAFGVEFRDQSESDRIVSDLECLTGLSREDLGIFPEEHSSIFGQVTMQYTVPGYEGKEIELTTSPDGLPIGAALMTAELVETEADLVLAVESGGIFSRLIETRCWEKFGAVLVHLGGQAPRSTRNLLKRLHCDLNLPVYIFTDGDPWGLHIARVIMAGSANAAHISDLAVPDAEWIGVTARDIEEYDLPTEKMSDSDLKRLDELSLDPRYQTAYWQNHILKFKDIRKKAEQQAFSRHGMDFVVDSYLPAKII